MQASRSPFQPAKQGARQFVEFGVVHFAGTPQALDTAGDIVVSETGIDGIGGRELFVHDVLADGFEVGHCFAVGEGVDDVSVAQFVRAKVRHAGQLAQKPQAARNAIAPVTSRRLSEHEVKAVRFDEAVPHPRQSHVAQCQVVPRSDDRVQIVQFGSFQQHGVGDGIVFGAHAEGGPLVDEYRPFVDVYGAQRQGGKRADAHTTQKEEGHGSAVALFGQVTRLIGEEGAHLVEGVDFAGGDGGFLGFGAQAVDVLALEDVAIGPVIARPLEEAARGVEEFALVLRGFPQVIEVLGEHGADLRRARQRGGGGPTQEMVYGGAGEVGGTRFVLQDFFVVAQVLASVLPIAAVDEVKSTAFHARTLLKRWIGLLH